MQIEVRKADMGKEKKRLKSVHMREYPRKHLSKKIHWKIKCLIIQR